MREHQRAVHGESESDGSVSSSEEEDDVSPLPQHIPVLPRPAKVPVFPGRAGRIPMRLPATTPPVLPGGARPPLATLHLAAGAAAGGPGMGSKPRLVTWGHFLATIRIFVEVEGELEARARARAWDSALSGSGMGQWE